MVNESHNLIEKIIALRQDPETNTTPGPSLQWYPERWFAESKIMLMSMAARGVHFHLLMLAWKGFALEEEPIPGSVPSDPEILRAICQRPDNWDEIWPEVARAWKEYSGRLWNLGLCKAYLSQIEHRKRRQSAGKKAAKARWDSTKQPRGATGGSEVAERHSESKPNTSNSPATSLSENEERQPNHSASAAKSHSGAVIEPCESHADAEAIACDSHITAPPKAGSEDAIVPCQTSPPSPSPSPPIPVSVSKRDKSVLKTNLDVRATASEVQALNISKSDRREVEQLLADPERIAPDKHRALKLTDEKAARIERIHLLANLAQSTAPTVEDRIAKGRSADSALDLWNLWRQQRKAKGKAERRPWFSEVQTLRKLLDEDHSPEEVIDALIAAGTAGWQGFEWTWVEGKGRQAAGAGNNRPTGAAGFQTS